jgi:hypothetical protein
VRVRLRDQLAQVAVPDRVLAQKREVVAVVERQLGAGDRAQPERPGRHRELHGAMEPIVVRQRERPMPLPRRRGHQLDRVGGAVEERERRMTMELYVHERMFA